MNEPSLTARTELLPRGWKRTTLRLGTLQVEVVRREEDKGREAWVTVHENWRYVGTAKVGE